MRFLTLLLIILAIAIHPTTFALARSEIFDEDFLPSDHVDAVTSDQTMSFPPDAPSIYDKVAGSPYTVSFDQRSLLINGVREMLQSGSIHYTRMPPDMWGPLMTLARQHGLNTLQTYVMWNWHSPEQGIIDFESDGRNITRFIELAGEAGLLVHLRIGPYVCAEWNFGGFPVWLKFVDGMEFRTDNAPWLKEMKNFVQAVLTEVEPLLARNGGPIALAQIENEYGSQEPYYGAGGVEYVLELAQWVTDLKIEIPWVMCVQLDAPQNIINTCNGFYCDQWIAAHVTRNPTQPHFWTENWNGWFQKWGEAVPHRPVEDNMFAVARWVMLGGSFHNYYMLHGGTNYGRWVGGPNIITSYDYDVAINEYGLPNPAKFNQSRTLHNWIAVYADALMAVNTLPPTVPLGIFQECTTYPATASGGPGVAFLANIATTAAQVNYSNTPFTLPPWSVSIVDLESLQVVFNTATGPFIGGEQNIIESDISEDEPSSPQDSWAAMLLGDEVQPSKKQKSSSPIVAAGDNNYLCAPDVFGITSYPETTIRSITPVEQFATTKDTSDYLHYAINVTISEGSIEQGYATLGLSDVGDYTLIQLQQLIPAGTFSMSSTVLPFAVPAGVTVPLNLSLLSSDTAELGWVAGEAYLLIVTQALGMQNFGPFLEKITKGLTGGNQSVEFQGEPVTGEWVQQVGLLGESLNFSTIPPWDGSVWQPTPECAQYNGQNFVWYRLQLNLALDADPTGVYAIDLGSMSKGALYVNGAHLGRYWLLEATQGICTPCSYIGSYDELACRTGCGEPSQRYYHVPRAWLVDGINQITLFEENPSRDINPAAVTIVRRN